MVNELVTAALQYAQAYRSLHQHLSKVLDPFNLTLLEWSFLTVIAEHPKSTMRQYAQIMSFDAPHITQLTHTLTERNLIKISPSETDKRMKFLELTDHGAAQVQEANRQIYERVNAVFDGLEQDDVNAHLKVLNHIILKTAQK